MSNEILEKYGNELIRLNYAESTQKVYGDCFSLFLYSFKGRDYRYIKKTEIEDWLTKLCIERDLSGAYQNQLINAVKFYYEKVLGMTRKVYKLNRPRKSFSIPDLLSDTEIQRIFDVCKNTKHKCIMSLLYGCGLRLSEVIDLKLVDIDYEGSYLRIIQSKGNKDRLVPVPDNVLELITGYLEEYKPVEYLFNGQSSNRYAGRSIEELVKTYGRLAGIKKRIHPHLLRHNFITEHCELGTNSMEIMEIVGHNSPKTLQRYYHFRRPKNLQDKSPINKVKL